MSSIPRPPADQPSVLRWAAQVTAYLQSLTLQTSPDVLVKRQAGGTTLYTKAKAVRGGAGGGAGPSPFDCSVSGTDLTLRPGTINQVLPSNMFSTLTLPGGSYTRYIVLTATCSSGEVTSAALSVETTQPVAPGVDAGSPPASFAVLLAVIVDGQVFRTIAPGSLQAQVVESFRADKASPTFGLSPYDIYYTWLVKEAGE